MPLPARCRLKTWLLSTIYYDFYAVSKQVCSTAVLLKRRLLKYTGLVRIVGSNETMKQTCTGDVDKV
eukprot:scaffold51833_cov19-Tisochrysis_lutea.AAC.2